MFVFVHDEMNGVLGHLCANIGYTRPGESPEDGEMSEMTLPSRHMIQNSIFGGLKQKLPLVSLFEFYICKMCHVLHS